MPANNNQNNNQNSDRPKYADHEKFIIINEIIETLDNENEISHTPEVEIPDWSGIPQDKLPFYKKEAEKLQWWWLINCKLFLWRKGDIEYSKNYKIPEIHYDVNKKVYNSKNIWLAIIENCINNKVHPLSLIKIIFTEFPSPSSVVPLPKDMLKKEVIEKYYEKEKAKEKDVNSQILLESSLFVASYQMASYVMALTQESALRAAIQRTDTQISPLFRYCISCKNSFDDLAQKWFILAKQQFLETPRCYIKYWKELITDKLLDTVKPYHISDK